MTPLQHIAYWVLFLAATALAYVAGVYKQKWEDSEFARKIMEQDFKFERAKFLELLRRAERWAP